MAYEPLYVKAGGEPKLRALLRDFYDRVFKDTMIGFHFRDADRERLIEKELELALALLGAEVSYTGVPLREAHFKHRILDGQFMRRVQILKETMAAHDLPPDVQDAWVEHTMSLRSSITRDSPGECQSSVISDHDHDQ